MKFLSARELKKQLIDKGWHKFYPFWPRITKMNDGKELNK